MVIYNNNAKGKEGRGGMRGLLYLGRDVTDRQMGPYTSP